MECASLGVMLNIRMPKFDSYLLGLAETHVQGHQQHQDTNAGVLKIFWVEDNILVPNTAWHRTQ